MIQDLLKDLVQQHLGILKKTRKGWQQRNCMVCHLRGESPDTRSRFGIKFEPDGKIAIHCFNCSFKATYVPGQTLSKNFKSFMRELGISGHDIQKIDFELFREKNDVEARDVKLKGVVTKTWKEEKLPDGSLSLMQWLENDCNDKNLIKAVNYALSRGFTNLHDLYWTPEKWKMFNKRIILPFRFKNKIVGYTGRFVGNPPDKAITKYHNHMPMDYIYNLDPQYDYARTFLIISEGVFDAYFTDGISPSGNTLNDDQVRLIRSLGKEVIVCPDRDKNGAELVRVAIENEWAVAFPEWEKGIKDPTSAVEKYGRILTLKSIIDSRESNPTTIQLKWKFSKNERK